MTCEKCQRQTGNYCFCVKHNRYECHECWLNENPDIKEAREKRMEEVVRRRYNTTE